MFRSLVLLALLGCVVPAKVEPASRTAKMRHTWRRAGSPSLQFSRAGYEDVPIS